MCDHVGCVRIGQIPIELMVLAIGVGPDTQCLGVPATVNDRPVDVVGLLDGDFPIMGRAIGRTTRIRMRAIVGIRSAIAGPQERFVDGSSQSTRGVVAPEKRGVVAGLLSRVYAPDIRPGADGLRSLRHDGAARKHDGANSAGDA